MTVSKALSMAVASIVHSSAIMTLFLADLSHKYSISFRLSAARAAAASNPSPLALVLHRDSLFLQTRPRQYLFSGALTCPAP